MATHSFETLLARLTWWFGLSSPAAYQQPAAALGKAPPNSDGAQAAATGRVPASGGGRSKCVAHARQGMGSAVKGGARRDSGRDQFLTTMRRLYCQ